eukprot:1141548-Pelagomonas_calceolata.AAC.2
MARMKRPIRFGCFPGCCCSIDFGYGGIWQGGASMLFWDSHQGKQQANVPGLSCYDLSVSTCNDEDVEPRYDV